ncbi:MAG: hypothetical protein IKG82_14605 [Oscillospiraceae bacterium]|nr:hypothetical protein [Oscillospiraceae bacterium]
MDDFSAIMNLPHHVSKKRRQMTLEERAVQFSAFAALSGYDEEIYETARLTSPREAMSEDDIAELDTAFQRLLDSESEYPTVTVTYFQPDERKEGGRYVLFSGVFRHFDATENKLIFSDGTLIPVQNITAITTETE